MRRKKKDNVRFLILHCPSSQIKNERRNERKTEIKKKNKPYENKKTMRQ